MTRYTYISALVAALLGMAVLVPAQAQENSTSGAKNKEEMAPNGRPYKRPRDEKRKCKARKDQDERAKALKDTEGKKGRLTKMSLGNNPREGQYRQEMERLLDLEIKNVSRTIQEVGQKHKELIQLYPHLRSYQVIVLEDVPGAWRDGEYVNSKKAIVMHYNSEGDLDCVVLDSMTRNVYNTTQFTRKILRLYYPHVQLMEMETYRYNYELPENLINTSPEIQLRAMRLVFQNLRAALYSMDMQIAAYYDLREKRNSWQINL